MNKFLLTLVVGTTTLFFATPGFSQETLVKDINTDPAVIRQSNDYSEIFCRCGDYLFFAVPGKELWRTDGTAEGTISLGDLRKGYTQGIPLDPSIKCVNNTTIYFRGNDGTHGWELWTSDGTPKGTKMVKDVTPGDNESWSSFTQLGLIDDTYYFFADHNYDGILELWKSNGTPGSTVIIPGFPSFDNVTYWISSDSHHFFLFKNSNTQKTEVWATDGTGPNTIRLLDDYGHGVKASVGDEIMFVLANSSDNTQALWTSDGTASGTQEVLDFGSQRPQMFSRYNSKLIFNVTNFSNEIWISDGTASGTKFLATGTALATVVIDNELYAAGHNFSTGTHEIFRTDGDNVELLHTVISNPGVRATYNTLAHISTGFVLQYGEEGTGREPGFFNLADKSFSLIKDINPGSASSTPRAWATLNDKAFFLADDGVHGTEIWITDGTAEGTALLKEMFSETANAFRFTTMPAYDLVENQGKLQMFAESGGKGAIFLSDGTESGTTLQAEVGVIATSFLGKVGGDMVYFYGFNISKTNGLENGTIVLHEMENFGSISLPFGSSYELGEKLVFAFGVNGGTLPYGLEYWVTDGTPARTHILKDINPGGSDGISYEGAKLGSKLIFQGIQPATGGELWITDGTSDGTQLLKDIKPGSEGSLPLAFVTLDDKVIFVADDGIHGNELWITDGTPEGTKLIVDIMSGSESSQPRFTKVAFGAVYFSVYDSDQGWTLWKTDGTAAGTQMVIDVIPGNEFYRSVNNLGAVGNQFYFTADHNEHGRELWVTDGTASGTSMIDIVEGQLGSNPEWMVNIQGIGYFKADASLWRTNGTQHGTFKVSDLEPFSVLEFDNFAYFKAYHPTYGIELFKVPVTKLDQEIIAEPIVVKTFGDLPFKINATATSGLPVEITSSEELTLNENTASIVRPGSVTITMRQEGDALFNAATLSETFCILPSKPVLTISSTSVNGIVLESSAPEGNQWSGPFGEIDANEKTHTASESGSYQVRVVIEGCESEWSNEEMVLITGIEKPEELLMLYPNPTVDDINIKASGYRDDVIVNLLNLQGTPLAKITLRTGETVNYSLQTYPSGIYLLKVETSQGTVYQKVVKK